MRCRDGDLIFSPALTEALNGTGYLVSYLVGIVPPARE